MRLWIALRHSARSLLRTPGLAGILITTIAMGIGSNAAVHGFIRGLIGAETAGASAAVTRVGILLRAAAGAVFVIACANVAGFLLARASARSKDTAARVALGADRRQLALEFLADGVFVSLAGGALGILLAFWTVAVIPALFFEPDAEQLVFAPDSGGVVAIAAACAVLTIACSLAPLVDVRHDNPALVLQRESLGTSRTSRRLRNVLVIIQMTCCCVLVISTGLLLRGFRTALETGIGQRLGNPILVTVQARARAGREETATHGLQYLSEVEQTAREVLNATSAAWVAQPPGSRPALQSLQIERPDVPLRDVVADVALFDTRSLPDVMLPPIAGRMFGGGDTPDRCPVVIVNEAAARELFGGNAVGQFLEDPAGARIEVIGVVATRPTAAAPVSRPAVYYYAAQARPPADRLGAMPFRVSARADNAHATLATNIVSAHYLETVGLQMVAGESFPVRQAAQGCRVGVVDQAAADLYFGGQAVGGAVIDRTGQRTTIVGVVQSSLLRHWQRAPEPAIYFPLWQDFTPRMTLLLRTADTSKQQLTTVAERLGSAAGGTGDTTATTLDIHLSRTALAPERIASVLVGAAAVTALALGALGVHGVMAESARQRRREIALRIALGAQRWRVLRQLLREGLGLGITGTVIGMAGALLVAPWLTPDGGTSGADAIWIWLGGPLALMAVVTIASVLPARRALSVDPWVVLREQ